MDISSIFTIWNVTPWFIQLICRKDVILIDTHILCYIPDNSWRMRSLLGIYFRWNTYGIAFNLKLLYMNINIIGEE